jgi:hypothetical protein
MAEPYWAYNPEQPLPSVPSLRVIMGDVMGDVGAETTCEDEARGRNWGTPLNPAGTRDGLQRTGQPTQIPATISRSYQGHLPLSTRGASPAILVVASCPDVG